MMPELVGSLIAAIYGGCMCFYGSPKMSVFTLDTLDTLVCFSSSFRLIMGRLIVLLMVSRQSSDGFGEPQDLLQGSSWQVLHC